MQTATQYRMRKLEQQLKSGKAWIEGKTCDGAQWPEGKHYWICIDGMETYHVLCDQKPKWGKYEIKQ